MYTFVEPLPLHSIRNKKMKKKYALGFMFCISFFTASLIYASRDNYVTDWAQKTLMDTLAASYLDTPEEVEVVQKKYSPAAWGPMSDFFHKELKIIQDQKLTLHPIPLTQATITRSENCISVHCWRVSQLYKIPELHMNIDFSLLIVSASPSGDSPFLIQSVDMKVHNY
jgi:hypothetical protein